MNSIERGVFACKHGLGVFAFARLHEEVFFSAIVQRRGDLGSGGESRSTVLGNRCFGWVEAQCLDHCRVDLHPAGEN